MQSQLGHFLPKWKEPKIYIQKELLQTDLGGALPKWEKDLHAKCIGSHQNFGTSSQSGKISRSRYINTKGVIANRFRMSHPKMGKDQDPDIPI